ncbi:MAG: response regulator [Deltaproteobacteria bacterium]|nr:response regulator [Deltaproteobacteria bacterium]
MPSRLLVVDGDPTSLRVFDVHLRGAGFDVETATNGTDAWARLELAPPDLVISDAEVEGIDGFELCARLRRRPGGGTIPFILVARDQTLHQKIRSLEAGADDYLVKPAYVKEVVARVRARLQHRDRDRLASFSTGGTKDASRILSGRFTGTLADVTVVDLMQLVAGAGRSGIVHLRSPSGNAGALYFREGAVVDAEVGRLAGMDAFSRLLAWTDGTFELEWKSIRRRDVIGRAPADLIIEGMAKLDEWNRLSATLPDRASVFEVNYGLLAERLAEIPDEMNAVLRLCDGVRTLKQVIDDSTMSDVQALTALGRLHEEGIILETGGGSKSGPKSLATGAAVASTMQSGAVPAAIGTGTTSASVGPVRRRTAPGLGQAPAVASFETTRSAQVEDAHNYGIPEARIDQRDGNVIRFAIPEEPRVGLPTPPWSAALANELSDTTDDSAAAIAAAASRIDADPPVSLLSRPHMDVADFREAATGEIESEKATDDTGRHAAGSLSPTRRGFATQGAPLVEAPDSAIPSDVADFPVDLRPDLRPDLPVDLPNPGAGPPDAPDATERISFRDDDISRRDAIDELGLPSRWRGLRFVIMAVVIVGGLAGVVAHRYRTVPSMETGERIVSPVAGAGPAIPAVPHPSGAVVEVADTVDKTASEPHGVGHGQVAAGGAVGSASAQSPVGALPDPPVALPAVALPDPVAAKGTGAVVSASAADDPHIDGGSAAHKDVGRQLGNCRTAFTRNRFREALVACAAAVAANPRSAEALTIMAHAELNLGHLGRAGELATKAIAIDPGIADAYVIVGGVHQDSGQNNQAKIAYRQYLQLAPRGRYADELRSIVNSL